MPLVRKPTQPPSAPRQESADILRHLASGSVDERWAAARAAVELPDAATKLAEALLSESDARVREAMLTTLARISTPESIAGIMPLLRSDDASLRTAALDALRSSVATSRELLPQLLKDADPDVRVLSCELARSLPSEEATRHLCAMLTDEQEINVCGAAIEVLAEVGNQDALAALAACARKFPGASFLVFAIKVATDRISSQSAPHRE